MVGQAHYTIKGRFSCLLITYRASSEGGVISLLVSEATGAAAILPFCCLITILLLQWKVRLKLPGFQHTLEAQSMDTLIELLA